MNVERLQRRLGTHLIRLLVYLAASSAVALALGEKGIAAAIMALGIALEATIFWIPAFRALKHESARSADDASAED